MSDLISRQDAINALKALQRCECRERDPGCWEDARDTIKALPSAERKGKWIYKNGAVVYPWWECYECSECGARSGLFKFCPNCGARMEGETE